MDTTDLDILSHRGCLSGPLPGSENTLTALLKAIDHGFGVEFDIQLTLDGDGLVLSHDPADRTPQRDVGSFLAFVARMEPGANHALNVKNLFTLKAITAMLEREQLKERFFLFDFELLTHDLADCRYLMRSLAADGFQIAYRLSEREPYLEQYAADPTVERIWLDELKRPWITRSQVRRLTDQGKQVTYVSPDLHARLGPDALPAHWEQMISWGVGGICTDYPLPLQRLLDGCNRPADSDSSRNGEARGSVYDETAVQKRAG
jgi:glycerophosphoryl diester phosphodiesterase